MDGSSDYIIPVVQGEFVISDDPRAILTTVLGSCVAVCLFDAEEGIGGMNHFLLPFGPGRDTTNLKFGANAMELLINGVLKRGGRRENLRAKVFGGASMNPAHRGIGTSNSGFARQFLKDEGIPCIAESTGGCSARRLRFWPVDGRARQLMVHGSGAEPAVPKLPQVEQPTADITLF